MNTKDIVEKLLYHQKWRRGEEVEMLEPKVVGDAIDAAITQLTETQAKLDGIVRELEHIAVDMTEQLSMYRVTDEKVEGWKNDLYELYKQHSDEGVKE